MKVNSKKIIPVFGMALLVGCGGGGSSDGDKGNSGSFSDKDISTNIANTNTTANSNIRIGTSLSRFNELTGIMKYSCDSRLCAKDENLSFDGSKTMRYNDQQSKIVVYSNVTEDYRFIQAMDNINEVIGRDIFDYRGVISLSYEDSGFINYSNYLPLQNEGVGGAIILSVGTTVDTNMGCSHGNYANRPNANLVGKHYVEADNAYANDYGYSWVNIDSPDGQCVASVEVATHELAHALGLYEHFDGFGIGGVFGEEAKVTLRTLYNNDAGTDPEQLTIYRTLP